MEDFVTYEQAVKLNELGFDGYRNYYYVTEPFCSGSNIYNFDVYIPEDIVEYIYVGECDEDKIIPCPSLAQAAKWLRNKWNFLISIGYYSNEDENPNKRYYWDYFIQEMPNPFMVDTHYNEFDTYESALSAGIDAVLKLIETNYENTSI